MNKKGQIEIFILLVLAFSLVSLVVLADKDTPNTILNKCRNDCATYKQGIGRNVDLDCVSKCLKIYNCEAK